MNEVEAMNLITDFYKELEFTSKEKRDLFFKALVGMKVPELVIKAHETGFQDGVEQEQYEPTISRAK
jgi:hypothetical protein